MGLGVGGLGLGTSANLDNVVFVLAVLGLTRWNKLHPIALPQLAHFLFTQAFPDLGIFPLLGLIQEQGGVIDPIAVLPMHSTIAVTGLTTLAMMGISFGLRCG